MMDKYPQSEEEKRFSFDELCRKANEIDKRVKKEKRKEEREKRRIADELDEIRSQDRKQWEYTNGGRNPIGDDPLTLDAEEQRMYEDLGKRDKRTDEQTTPSDSIIPFVLIGIAFLIIIHLHNKHFQ